MAKLLYSYVVDHDGRYAPNPERDMCTLVHCKFQKKGSKRRNLVEMAREGDWVLGTGGLGADSAGHGKIIYLMRIDEKIPFKQYLKEERFRHRYDQEDNGEGNQFALISHYYYFFGKGMALDISKMPCNLKNVDWEKRGPGYKKTFSEDEIEALVSWFKNNFPPGDQNSFQKTDKKGQGKGCKRAKKAPSCSLCYVDKK